MGLLLAVLDDLLSFARTALFGVLFEKKVVCTSTTPTTSLILLESATAQLALPGHNIFTESILPTEKIVQAHIQVGVQYFIGEPSTFLYIDPVVSFDGVLQILNYGEMVSVVKFGGRWAFVQAGTIEGWIFKDALREQATDVFPVLIEDVSYHFNDVQTEKLRLCIGDVFNGTAAKTSLTDVEYVMYVLSKKNIQIVWSAIRPRIAGTWQRILRGQTGIHIGITPKTDTVMEYVVDDVGHVCYVEAVFSDETIKVRGVGLLEEGVLSILMLGKEEWRELRPVFIEVA